MLLQVVVLAEYGYNFAIKGISYNKKQTNLTKIEKVAKKLATADGGHNKFLESIQVWIEINAPRYFWQEFDTYRVGVTKQSESTMHTLTKDDLSLDSTFEPGINPAHIDYIVNLISRYKEDPSNELFVDIKANLPEGFMQKRVVSTNYKTLRTIIAQRSKHRLPHWQKFCKELQLQLEFPEFLEQRKDQ